MEQTANLNLPYIMPSQAQKHVTHNEAIRSLDALVHLAILDRDLAAPPASPDEGDRYLVATGGVGAWAGRDGQTAAWQDGAWAFLTPRGGWLAWLADEARLLSFDGSAWMDAAVHSVNPASLVGVNTTADSTDRLALKSPASLFDHDGDDHRMKINKASAGDTASLVFQSGYSGRAEFGLAGDDDWHVKVSSDGAAWVEALKVDAATGRVRLPAGLALADQDQVVARRHVRELLAASRTYFVRADGSDANSGLANDAGGAFLTVQKAVDVTLGTLDLAGRDVTIQVGAGAFGAVSFASAQVGAGNITISGDLVTPANVTVGAITVDGAGCRLFIQGLNVSKASALSCVNVKNGGYLKTTGKNQFSSISGGHRFLAELCGTIEAVGEEIVQGTVAGGHYRAHQNGVIYCQGAVWTASGTATQLAFAQASVAGVIYAFANSSSGAFTGSRYSATLNGVIQSNGGGASYFPGSSAGSTATGGQYA